MKNDSDQENYNREFQDLQMQIYDLAQIQFNGVSLFAIRDSDSGGTAGAAIIGDLGSDNTLSVFASANGASGPTVSVNKAALLSALTINRQQSQLGVGQEFQDRGTGQVRSFAAVDISEVIDLTDVSVGVFTQAIQNIATLRADNGGSMSRLRHASDDVALQKTNMIAANGGSRMWISQRRARTWRSIKYSFRHPHRCWPRPTLIRTSPSCCSDKATVTYKRTDLKTRGFRPPPTRSDGTGDREVSGSTNHRSRRIIPCHSQ